MCGQVCGAAQGEREGEGGADAGGEEEEAGGEEAAGALVSTEQCELLGDISEDSDGDNDDSSEVLTDVLVRVAGRETDIKNIISVFS